MAWELYWEQEVELEATLAKLFLQDRADSKGPQGRREDCSLGILAAAQNQDIHSMDQEDNHSRDPGSGQGLGDTGETWRVRGYMGSRAGQEPGTVARSGTEVDNLVEDDILVERDNPVEVGNLV